MIRCILIFVFVFNAFIPIELAAQKETLNAMDKKGQKQGPWKENYSDSEKIKYKGQFKDGKPFGEFEYFYLNGALQSKLNHEPTGVTRCKVYYPDSTLKAVGVYLGSVKDSTWTFYNEYGNKISEEHYVDGKAYGIWRTFYDNGKLMEEKYYEDNFENGLFKQYYPSGLVSREAKYVKGSIEGDAAFYHENGMVRMSGKYVHDAKQGPWKTFDDQGNQIDERIYNKGVPEFRESDLEDGDTSNYIIKDRLVPADFFEENYMEIPDKDQEKSTKGKKK